MRLLQQKSTPQVSFRSLLEQVVSELETMPKSERQRWLELLSYVVAMVYHEREEMEHADLQTRIEKSVQTDEHRREVKVMGKSMADVHWEAARLESRRETL